MPRWLQTASGPPEREALSGPRRNDFRQKTVTGTRPGCKPLQGNVKPPFAGSPAAALVYERKHRPLSIEGDAQLIYIPDDASGFIRLNALRLSRRALAQGAPRSRPRAALKRG